MRSILVFIAAIPLAACTDDKPPPPKPAASASASSTAAKATVAVPLTPPPITSASSASSATDAAVVVHGDCVFKGTRPSSPIKDLDKGLAALEPKLKATYEHALGINPSIEGTIRFGAFVEPDGQIASFIGKSGEVPHAFINDVNAVVQTGRLEGTGKPVELRGTIVCSRAK